VDKRAGRHPQRILIVDDSQDIRDLLCILLESWGFTVDEAENGADAIAHAGVRRPDLVLMDLWMPVMNGWEAITYLRTDHITRDVPIIVMTADTSAPSIERVQQCRPDAFLIKPVAPDHLREVIRMTFNRRGPAPWPP
jgi:CheY-like chemotaxis protein